LDKINENIKNEKRLTNHYKSVATGKPVVEEDYNIRLISSNQELNKNFENQFYFLMSKYIIDQSQLTHIRAKLTPEMQLTHIRAKLTHIRAINTYSSKSELVHNDKLFLDKLHNMLLKNVNQKYPATLSLNSAMDASNEPDIVMQKASEAMNQAVNEPISEVEKNTTNNLQMIENMIRWIGDNATICSTIFVARYL
jgi:hypothetical protein